MTFARWIWQQAVPGDFRRSRAEAAAKAPAWVPSRGVGSPHAAAPWLKRGATGHRESRTTCLKTGVLVPAPPVLSFPSGMGADTSGPCRARAGPRAEVPGTRRVPEMHDGRVLAGAGPSRGARSCSHPQGSLPQPGGPGLLGGRAAPELTRARGAVSRSAEAHAARPCGFPVRFLSESMGPFTHPIEQLSSLLFPGCAVQKACHLGTRPVPAPLCNSHEHADKGGRRGGRGRQAGRTQALNLAPGGSRPGPVFSRGQLLLF